MIQNHSSTATPRDSEKKESSETLAQNANQFKKLWSFVRIISSLSPAVEHHRLAPLFAVVQSQQKMACPSLQQLLFVLQILLQSRVLIEHADAHGQAFIQTDNELRYTTVDGIFHGISSEGFAEINIEQISEEEDDPTDDAQGAVLLK